MRSDIEQLENGLAISDGGKERIGPSGRIDILAIDARKQIVVIELKVGTAEHEVISQILSYMGTFKRKLEACKGIVIARDFTAHAVAASVPSIEPR